MSKVLTTIKIDGEVIREFIDVIESHNFSFRHEVENYIQDFFDKIVLLFDQEKLTVEVRMK